MINENILTVLFFQERLVQNAGRDIFVNGLGVVLKQLFAIREETYMRKKEKRKRSLNEENVFHYVGY